MKLVADDDGSDNEKMQKMKQLADDDSVEAVAAQNLQGEIQESQGDDDGSNNEKMKKMKQVADDDSVEAVPAQNNLQGEIQESQGDDDGSNNEKMKKVKQVAEDDSVEAVPAQNLQEVKVQESQDIRDAMDRRGKAISKESNSEQKSTDASKITRKGKKKRVEDDDNVAPVKKKRFMLDDNALMVREKVISSEENRLPEFLFGKKLGSEDVDGPLKTMHLTRLSQVMSVLSQEESTKVCNSLIKNTVASLSVDATDQKGGVYEFQLNWDGVFVPASEWARLVKGNGLREGDTLKASVYWLRDDLCLAIFFQKAT